MQNKKRSVWFDIGVIISHFCACGGKGKEVPDHSLERNLLKIAW